MGINCQERFQNLSHNLKPNLGRHLCILNSHILHKYNNQGVVALKSCKEFYFLLQEQIPLPLWLRMSNLIHNLLDHKLVWWLLFLSNLQKQVVFLKFRFFPFEHLFAYQLSLDLGLCEWILFKSNQQIEWLPFYKFLICQDCVR